mgnify:CR=1 FL=1
MPFIALNYLKIRAMVSVVNAAMFYVYIESERETRERERRMLKKK